MRPGVGGPSSCSSVTIAMAGRPPWRMPPRPMPPPPIPPPIPPPMPPYCACTGTAIASAQSAPTSVDHRILHLELGNPESHRANDHTTSIYGGRRGAVGCHTATFRHASAPSRRHRRRRPHRAGVRHFGPSPRPGAAGDRCRADREFHRALPARHDVLHDAGAPGDRQPPDRLCRRQADPGGGHDVLPRRGPRGGARGPDVHPTGDGRAAEEPHPLRHRGRRRHGRAHLRPPRSGHRLLRPPESPSRARRESAARPPLLRRGAPQLGPGCRRGRRQEFGGRGGAAAVPGRRPRDAGLSRQRPQAQREVLAESRYREPAPGR